MRVLSWNLYHGRDFPPDPALLTTRSRVLRRTERNATHAQVNRPLLPEFAHWLGAHPWDVALLQEAPPRWYRPFVRRTRSSGAIALTSRNLLPGVQWRLADLNPDLLASSDGGSNQILVRAPGRIAEVRQLQLARRPERRRMVWARLELPAGRVCVANLHASAGLPDAAGAELELAAELAVDWAAGDPLMLGGDLNLRPARSPAPFVAVRERFGLGDPTSPTAIDHLLVRGMAVEERPCRLPAEERELIEPDGLRIRLSDHAPVVARFSVP
jgi:endonuclease/exonuclease/phosphatase family metal-dependent hydrolase